MIAPADCRASLLRASSPATRALRRFTCVRNGRPTYDFHQTSPHGPTGAVPSVRAWSARSMLLSLRCRVPSVRAPGLDFHLLSERHARRTLRATRPLRGPRERRRIPFCTTHCSVWHEAASPRHRAEQSASLAVASRCSDGIASASPGSGPARRAVGLGCAPSRRQRCKFRERSPDR